jgi:hypothetical protein
MQARLFFHQELRSGYIQTLLIFSQFYRFYSKLFFKSGGKNLNRIFFTFIQKLEATINIGFCDEFRININNIFKVCVLFNFGSLNQMIKLNQICDNEVSSLSKPSDFFSCLEIFIFRQVLPSHIV